MQCWRFHDGWFLYFRLSRPGWGIYVGILVNEPSHLPTARGWARVPGQEHLSGRQGGQSGCREALPARRPQEPGEEGGSILGPQPRSRSWKLRRR